METVIDDNALTGLFKEFQMFSDFSVLPFDFNATVVVFQINTAKAKAAFDGAVSIEVRKSAAQGFADKLEADGFVVSFS
jgi:hypothetical protein